MSADLTLREDAMELDEPLGYPDSYAKLCADRSAWVYDRPFPSLLPHSLQQHEIARARKMEKMFPIRDAKIKSTARTKIHITRLWQQLHHLGNAGFDPDVIRVDPYGNVLYFHADKASPLAWDIDHWFPCSRGGLSVPSNLRIVQWQVCKKKHNKLEFLVPWWDLQLGISVNQFLSIFDTSNTEFRKRAFSYFFNDGEGEILSPFHKVRYHSFPPNFLESKERLGLAPAAIGTFHKEETDSSPVLKVLDRNQYAGSLPVSNATKKSKQRVLKENENPDVSVNPYQAILMARDSLRQREGSQKMKAEVQKMDDEVRLMKLRTDEERVALQELEKALLKKKRRVEKWRQLAEELSAYRSVLEKMLRDAMHQNVVNKERVRLNQAATGALMARIEAQKALCDSTERDIVSRFKRRDDLERQIHAKQEEFQEICEAEDEEGNLPQIEASMASARRELREFLDEQRARDSCLDEIKAMNLEQVNEVEDSKQGGHGVGPTQKCKRFPFPVSKEEEEEEEDDEESKKIRGRGNLERWVQMLLEDGVESSGAKKPKCLAGGPKCSEAERHVNTAIVEEKKKWVGSRKSFEDKTMNRCESEKAFRRIPSSPSIASNMRRGMECRSKKTPAREDDGGGDSSVRNNLVRASIRAIKHAVRI